MTRSVGAADAATSDPCGVIPAEACPSGASWAGLTSTCTRCAGGEGRITQPSPGSCPVPAAVAPSKGAKAPRNAKRIVALEIALRNDTILFIVMLLGPAAGNQIRSGGVDRRCAPSNWHCNTQGLPRCESADQCNGFVGFVGNGLGEGAPASPRGKLNLPIYAVVSHIQ